MLPKHNFGTSAWLDSDAFLCESIDESKMKCTLCETGWMGSSQVDSHKNGNKHFSRMWRILNANSEHKCRTQLISTGLLKTKCREYFRNIPQRGFQTSMYESLLAAYTSSDALSQLERKLHSHVTYEGIICIILKFTQLNRAGSAFFYSKCIMAFLGRGHNAAKACTF